MEKLLEVTKIYIVLISRRIGRALLLMQENMVCKNLARLTRRYLSFQYKPIVYKSYYLENFYSTLLMNSSWANWYQKRHKYASESNDLSRRVSYQKTSLTEILHWERFKFSAYCHLKRWKTEFHLLYLDREVRQWIYFIGSNEKSSLESNLSTEVIFERKLY